MCVCVSVYWWIKCVLKTKSICHDWKTYYKNLHLNLHGISKVCVRACTTPHTHIKIPTIVLFYWAHGDSHFSSLPLLYFFFFSASSRWCAKIKIIPYGSSDRFDFRVCFWPCRFLLFFLFFRGNEPHNCHSWFQFSKNEEKTWSDNSKNNEHSFVTFCTVLSFHF